MLILKARTLAASISGLALFATFAALTGACTSPVGPDLLLSEVSGNYGPVLTGDNLLLTATFTSNSVDTHTTDNNGNEVFTNHLSGNVQASLLSDLNPLLGSSWDSASISVGSTDLVLTQNPTSAFPTEYSIALSQVTPGDSSPVSYYHSETQLGQTVSDAASSGCEALTTEYLSLDIHETNLDANIIERTVFNDISPIGGGTDVTCAQLFAQIQADVRSGNTTGQNQLFAVFVTNGVISVDQIAQLQELDVSAGLSAIKIPNGPAASSSAHSSSLQATGHSAVASANAQRVHAAILSALRR